MYLEKSHVTKVCNAVSRRVDVLFGLADPSKLPVPGDVNWLMLEGAIACLFAIADNAQDVLDWFEHAPISNDLLRKINIYKEFQ